MLHSRGCALSVMCWFLLSTEAEKLTDQSKLWSINTCLWANSKQDGICCFFATSHFLNKWSPHAFIQHEPDLWGLIPVCVLWTFSHRCHRRLYCSSCRIAVSLLVAFLKSMIHYALRYNQVLEKRTFLSLALVVFLKNVVCLCLFLSLDRIMFHWNWGSPKTQPCWKWELE